MLGLRGIVLKKLNDAVPVWLSTAGLKYFPPIIHESFEKVERPKLRAMDRSPLCLPNARPHKMQKRLRLMRGPELIHNKLLYNQFGVVALGGGRLRHGHYEMLRLTIGKKMDVNRMFAIWRIPAPWQPVTKKGQGQRMGGGKGAIDHYVTPIKRGRVIVELAGKCEFEEVKPFLQIVADKLPFKAMVVSQKLMEEMAAEEKKLESEDMNLFSMKYVIQNNLSGCHKFLSPVDHKWFGKYL